MADECAGSMATITDGHKRLQPFIGTFRAVVRLWMGPGEPLVSTGVMRNEWDLGGLYLRHTYKGDPNEGPFPDFEGRGYWSYNPATDQYEGFWIDNAACVMQTEQGRVDETGRVWTMRGETPNPQDGSKTIRKRTVVTLLDDDHHTMETYFESPQGEFKGMEIQYERIA